jgi:hypothetical protein
MARLNDQVLCLYICCICVLYLYCVSVFCVFLCVSCVFLCRVLCVCFIAFDFLRFCRKKKTSRLATPHRPKTSQDKKQNRVSTRRRGKRDNNEYRR